MQSDYLSPFRAKRLAQYIKHLSGLLAYYPLNETDGATVYNKAPSTLGTLPGTITGATVGKEGKVGKSYLFDGTNDRVSLGDVPAISDATSLSVVMLVKCNNITQDHQLFGNGTGVGAGTILFADDVGSSSGRTDTFTISIQEDPGNGVNSAKIEGATGANSVAWKMVGFTFTANDAAGLHLYLNGTEDANSPVTTANVANVGLQNNAVTFGEIHDGTKDANAYIQHIAIFNRVLTATEMRKLAKIAGLA